MMYTNQFTGPIPRKIYSFVKLATLEASLLDALTVLHTIGGNFLSLNLNLSTKAINEYIYVDLKDLLVNN